MIEVAFSCDYYYYCHADCSGQGLKVTCGLGTLGCEGGAGRWRPSPRNAAPEPASGRLASGCALALSGHRESSSPAHAVVGLLFSSLPLRPLDHQCVSPFRGARLSWAASASHTQLTLPLTLLHDLVNSQGSTGVAFQEEGLMP